MAELKDLIQTIIRKTEDETLTWHMRKGFGSWRTTHGSCEFLVYPAEFFFNQPTLSVSWNNGVWSGHNTMRDKEVCSLISLLEAMYPINPPSQSGTFQIIMDCLDGPDSTQ